MSSDCCCFCCASWGKRRTGDRYRARLSDFCARNSRFQRPRQKKRRHALSFLSGEADEQLRDGPAPDGHAEKKEENGEADHAQNLSLTEKRIARFSFHANERND